MPKGMRNPREEQTLESSGGGMGGGGGYSSAPAPKVVNSIYPEIPGGTPSGQWAYRNVRSPEEIKAIKESGYMLPKEGKKQKYFTQGTPRTENAFGGSSVIRVPIDKVPSDTAVSRKDVEIYNRDSGKFEALKKKVDQSRRWPPVVKHLVHPDAQTA